MMEGMFPLGKELKVVRLLAKAPSGLVKLNFEDVYFVKELHINLFSVSRMCDKKNSVLFTETKCFVLSPNFKLADESQVLLKVSRKNNMYSFDIKNIVPQKDLTCLMAKATNDKSMLWHRRIGHINFKNINKLVKDNLVRGLPLKCFENDQTCVACLKGKQHKVSFKNKLHNSISQPLFMLHMDLFCPTSVSSIMHKKYCLVITDDFSKFTWVFFLATKGETSRILKSFITKIENLVEKKVNIIRCDNRTEFKNRVINEFCKEKDQLGKFDGKLDEGIFVGYCITSKAFRVYNIRTTKVEENMHITFLENKPMIVGTNSNDFADNSLFDSSSQSSNGHNKDKHGPSQASESDKQERPNAESSTKTVNTARPVNIADHPNDPLMPDLEDDRIFDDAQDDRDEGVEADYNNLETIISVSPIPSTRIHKDHPKEHIIREVNYAVQTRKMAKQNEAGLISFINKQRRTNHKIFKIICLLVFSLRWNQIRNKARLVAQGHRQEEGIYYDEVFAHVAQIKAIRLFLTYASFMDFIAYQIDVKSTFLYGTIEEEHTIVANSTTEAEYIAASNYCRQVLCLQNQLLDYGYNFMQTKIHVYNESAICVVKNLVYHSNTKHIEIRHHFIRDSYEKRLIEMVKIHTDYNVADLLTKAFDVTRF
nr:putative ribonuclease H-like domain-containing protein [Tanacetum cinerariifolium]